MPRIFLPISDKDKEIIIKEEKAHYLINVLRLKKGDEFEVINGKGKCFLLLIKEISKKEINCEVKNISGCNIESPISIILAQGILKGNKMDLVIQKATELGVKEIVPIVTERSQLKETRKLNRWQKIAEEASKQSGRSIVPLIHKSIEFIELIDNYKSRTRKGLIFYEKDGISLKDAIKKLDNNNNLLIIIGPEGGFTREEVNYAKEKGLIITSLGKRILRSETAAIVAIALVQFLLGDLD
ncbi:MAG: 16S rRNA (uracil(1498)-N(3))-methyltransferase [Candidatus Omnitrophica bacterium]|nr:16S rRNA (uracil(1498)-N(3))-methyltransferase [Candidatus Omnitrophota bacterium]